MADSHDLVRRMWIAYREGGVEGALPLLHPEVEFVAADGTSYRGHDGVRRFFQEFADHDRTFEASPYSFEGHGDAVLVAGHRRIHWAGGSSGAYLYFVHAFDDGLIAWLSAHTTREAALAELHQRGGTRPAGEPAASD